MALHFGHLLYQGQVQHRIILGFHHILQILFYLPTITLLLHMLMLLVFNNNNIAYTFSINSISNSYSNSTSDVQEDLNLSLIHRDNPNLVFVGRMGNQKLSR